ncbi:MULTISPECIES: hypothetical protein [unclassified Modicisalibacter]|uniref:hypothetical protein n=1 Tax=unclassified Modicisalibacter TaxID=2679913 RepID=UPI001CD02DC7|nr:MULTISPECIES: hypothetical protein [unclassified Modicisalibacter]MBZ9557755.1 hypothetical protein [Modicisalibacter sp. R2A 31.J]MBZ9573581.1 hypothetical protein [Modicisalibacter sp. MOD 31.J]
MPQLAILFSTFLGVGIVSDLGYTLLSTTGARWMTARLRRCLHRCGAGSLVGAGLLMALARRPAA